VFVARKNVAIARKLRQTSTDAEALFWHHARARQIAGAKFRRQHPIAGFVVDFVCTEAALIVEIDGGGSTMRTARTNCGRESSMRKASKFYDSGTTTC
jgi:very-short-patch-repair endonuclease